MSIKSTIGGLAGACTLTILNESVKKLDKDAPRLDLLGMNAAAKLIKGSGLNPSTRQLRSVSLGGDLISNSLYYGMANAGDNKSTLIRGAVLGLSAGVSAISLAKPLGLDERVVAASPKTKAL